MFVCMWLDDKLGTVPGWNLPSPLDCRERLQQTLAEQQMDRLVNGLVDG